MPSLPSIAMAAGSGGCQAGLPGEGGGEVAPAVHADLAVDGLGVVADGVGDRNRVAAMSSADRPPMIRAATSRSPGGEVPGAHEHAGEVGGGRGLDGDGVSAVDLGPDQRCHADQCPGAVGGLQLGLRRLVRLRRWPPTRGCEPTATSAAGRSRSLTARPSTACGPTNALPYHSTRSPRPSRSTVGPPIRTWNYGERSPRCHPSSAVPSLTTMCRFALRPGHLAARYQRGGLAPRCGRRHRQASYRLGREATQ